MDKRVKALKELQKRKCEEKEKIFEKQGEE